MSSLQFFKREGANFRRDKKKYFDLIELERSNFRWKLFVGPVGINNFIVIRNMKVKNRVNDHFIIHV